MIQSINKVGSYLDKVYLPNADDRNKILAMAQDQINLAKIRLEQVDIMCDLLSMEQEIYMEDNGESGSWLSSAFQDIELLDNLRKKYENRISSYKNLIYQAKK